MTKHITASTRRIAALTALAIAVLPVGFITATQLAVAAGPWYR